MANSFICQLCVDLTDFPSLLALQQHMKNGIHSTSLPPEPQEPIISQVVPEQPKRNPNLPPAEPKVEVPAEPIKLMYKFSGQCPKCKTPVKTIEVELPDKNVVTAYCVPCDQKLFQQLVVPIDKQV